MLLKKPRATGSGFLAYVSPRCYDCRRAEQTMEKIYSRLKAFIESHWLIVHSSLLFAFFIGVWLIAYPLIVQEKILDMFLKLTATLTGVLLNLLGAGVEVSGTSVSSPAFSLRIGHECTALVPMVILSAAVLAYPSRTREKLQGLGIGLPVLLALNFVRVVTLYYVGVFIPGFFETAHFVVWQSVMVISVIVLWLLWVGKMVSVGHA